MNSRVFQVGCLGRLSWLLALSLFVGGLNCRNGMAQGAEADPREELLALLRERNIFDPNRRERRSEEAREVVAPPSVHSFLLTGALLHDDTALAFFDGSEPEYRRVLAVGDSIAGYSVVKVETTGVTLAKDEVPVRLDVGMAMRRVGSGDWTPTEERWEMRRGPEPEPSAAPTVSQPGPTDASDAGGDMNDIMRRMMERRRQEGSQ